MISDESSGVRSGDNTYIYILSIFVLWAQSVDWKYRDPDRQFHQSRMPTGSEIVEIGGSNPLRVARHSRYHF